MILTSFAASIKEGKSWSEMDLLNSDEAWFCRSGKASSIPVNPADEIRDILWGRGSLGVPREHVAKE